MKVDEFDFDLPRDRIALRPVLPRDEARLLRVSGAALSDHRMLDLPSLLQPGDVMVVNDTKVLPAQLTARRNGAKISLTLVEAVRADEWQAFAKPAKKLAVGDRLEIAADFSAVVSGRGEGGLVALVFNRSGPALMAALMAHGTMPLPPYIKRDGGPDDRDRADYQTIFAERLGAVAAPTAGLHFTPRLLAALEARGVERVALTLHVGAGTFLPVTTQDTADHKMHAEWGELSAQAALRINRARAEGGRVVAVGSTATRLLESAAEPSGELRPFQGRTDIFITPGYRFRVVDRMVTNFHLPRSTLIMLVAAFAGMETMRAAYHHAITNGYRFYSYGDGSLLERAS